MRFTLPVETGTLLELHAQLVFRHSSCTLADRTLPVDIDERTCSSLDLDRRVLDDNNRMTSCAE